MAGKIIGNYQITDELAHGSLGAVYRGHHINLTREVVIKEISLNHFPISTRVQLKARFRRETFIQAQLDHPGIARLYESFARGDNYYLVIEYVTGISLRELLERQGLPTPAQAIHLCKQALAALDYAHNFQYLTESDVQRTGIIHRDLKPANLFIDSRGKLKITDFGIVKMPDKQSIAPPSFRPGTTEYMPPEQLRGLELDARSDIYSLGVTFYEMLTGQLPFSKTTKSTEDAVRKNILESGAVQISEIRSDISPVLSSIFMRTLVRNPSERFQTAADFLKAIKEYERGNGAAELTASQVAVKIKEGQPEQVTIVEIAAKPEKQPVTEPSMTTALSSSQLPSAHLASQQLELPEQRKPAASLNQQPLPTSRLQYEMETDNGGENGHEHLVSSVRTELVPDDPQSLTQTDSLDAMIEQERNPTSLFENWENTSRSSRKPLIAAAAAAILISGLFGAYFLTHRQGAAKTAGPQPVASATPPVASTATGSLANAATPQPAVSQPAAPQPAASAVPPPALSATPQPEPPAALGTTGNVNKLQRARVADRVGNFKQAEGLYEDYLRSGPSDADAASATAQLEALKQFVAYLKAAKIAFKRRNYEAARDNYAEALKLRPASKMVQTGLAKAQARAS